MGKAVSAWNFCGMANTPAFSGSVWFPISILSSYFNFLCLPAGLIEPVQAVQKLR
jgi:hypothetical protein